MEGYTKKNGQDSSMTRRSGDEDTMGVRRGVSDIRQLIEVSIQEPMLPDRLKIELPDT